ncbi:hypothetical protein [Marinobacter sp. NFXS9]|uniref:hypothetical protein n=1 Tax=Marinobacter sp. NFXS9 TaxID=2818433 RepID=UPI0032DF155F
MPEVKGSYLARSAAMLCQDESFRLYLDRASSKKAGVEIPDGTHNEEDARDVILTACGIKSRAELDHNFTAAAKFRQIKGHYQRWKARRDRRQQAQEQPAV